ncbi:hypothetical protein [Tepidibacter hydrothermalis]|uniref:Uncharacterized protein n=1 Tax=Tepidibacter hydrothermalis TaxID=3036126 RepID=A0ABY8E7E0_9FIRM|nr:hypothetical protein [Tepidibacter hydrothermalis]WFD08761.1 hypothetical protein P4S50_10160 [Tepidibacter hydrothermalis]
MEFSKNMNFSERLAYYIMKTQMNNYEIKFNELQSNGEADFELILSNNEYKIPVEVTTSVNQDLKETIEVIKKNPVIERKRERKYCWIIDPGKSANIKRIKEEIDNYLYLLEKEGIQRFNGLDIYKYTPDINNTIKKICYELNIESATCIGFRDKGCIYITLPGDGTWLDENNVTEAVKKELEKEDNRNKLNAGIKEKHFFVYIDPNNYPAWYAITRITQPKSFLKTDFKDLTVWVVTLIAKKCVIWKTNNDSKWEIKEINIADDVETQLLNNN